MNAAKAGKRASLMFHFPKQPKRFPMRMLLVKVSSCDLEENEQHSRTFRHMTATTIMRRGKTATP